MIRVTFSIFRKIVSSPDKYLRCFRQFSGASPLLNRTFTTSISLSLSIPILLAGITIIMPYHLRLPKLHRTAKSSVLAYKNPDQYCN